MIARLSSLVVWGLVALATVAWGLRITSRPTPVPAHATVADAGVVVAGDLSRLLGQPPAAPAVAEAAAPVTDARFKLVGVVAPKAGGSPALALISVDGQLPRATRVGREVEPGVQLRAVDHRHAELAGPGQAPIRLELPPLPEAQRGRLGEAVPGGGAAMPPAAGGMPMPPGGPAMAGRFGAGQMAPAGNAPPSIANRPGVMPPPPAEAEAATDASGAATQ